MLMIMIKIIIYYYYLYMHLRVTRVNTTPISISPNLMTTSISKEILQYKVYFKNIYLFPYHHYFHNVACKKEKGKEKKIGQEKKALQQLTNW